ncbi:TetR/AcrR family transcriptional regulator [Microlunatus endophyticus]|uniref:TetR/AcrR family transcriptional regulator n=1 Tax=Microlunatus endophyticus TaxID=1716077 RepID=UPI001E56338E|nr:TetR/AcrR family transcriptional regulator [Microlunatus endophyticus]
MSESRTSRRERPAKPALTREGIIAAAVAIMRTEGLQRVTMRRLATELDTGPASLYVYVANTAELHAAVLDELLGEVELGGASGDWADQLIGVLTSYVEVLTANPQLARTAVATRPNGPNYLRLVDRILGLLADGGVARTRAAWGVDLLLLAGTAHAAEHAGAGATADQEWETLGQTLSTVDPRRHPHIHELSDLLLAGSHTERLTWSFQALIEGLSRTEVPGE